MTQNWTYPGARWWKFDFHTHTPASKDTEAWQKAIGTPEEITPEKWLLKYMAAEVDCVAVTDHNSGDWIDTLKSAYARMKSAADTGDAPDGFRELFLFPGVEISVQGGFHLLAIFDPSVSGQTVSDMLAVVRYDGTRGDSDGVTREGAAKVVEEVLAAGGVAIPAHVDGDKGLLQVEPGTRKCQLDTTTVKQVLQEPGILAVEWCDRTRQAPVILDELKLSFAQVLGSDCHTFLGPAVPGSRYTWVKMARPGLEGLRLALLDGQQGVSVRRSDDGDGFAPFDKPEHFIESIEIHDARFMGRRKPATLAFNPYFNALIGGRGTGKSTVVHALRLAYRREKELMPSSEAGQTFARFNKAAKNRNDEGGLRPDTQISVQVSRDGTPYRLIWRQDGHGHVVEEWDESTKDFKQSSSQLINEQRFPIRLFSQGQIAALAGESQQSLLRVIDDAAGTSVQQAAFDETRRSFFATRAQMRELDGKLQTRDALALNLQDLQRKLARFEGADHAVVLKNFQRTSRQSRELERQFESAGDLARRLKDFARELFAEDLPDGLFDVLADDPALQVVQKLRAEIGKARSEIERAAKQLDEQSRGLKTELEGSTWAAQVEDARTAYEKLKADLQQQGVNDPSEYGRLVQEKQRVENDVKRLEALQKQRDALKEKARVQLDQVKVARQAISVRRNDFLTSSLEGNSYVRMELIPYSRDARAIERSLRDLLGAVEGKYTDDVYQEAQDGAPAKGLVADLMLPSELNEKADQWDTPAFETAIQDLKRRLAKACRGEGDFGSWFSKFLKAETEKRPEFIDHILCWFPEDGLQVEYSRKGDGRDFQSIGQASAGQRAAAMLAFLLAHGSEPLVLDQPEDDLDNHLIYGLVVQQIRSNKLRRQLIIVTHNPNIVVNGDAELIHVLDFNNQCFVKQTGSLQDQAMRDEVCQVMEGGKEAFERRYQRLGREV
ncbi:AAA family ATPase (plasmid) [Burkholderia thailandensis]|uniref:TrlF family AAA-like ATPase n=1 Tax=Burkholderia thailandensis TaxID=57975 RepID=UPI00192D8C55|nr:AAA family ATPase [Burkholderia thailandensis]MBS2132359.1 AAA family ATPase [Burkholderia thailandensis]QRA15164.1 AAA family ATPase [Burkholderia thailandensis]